MKKLSNSTQNFFRYSFKGNGKYYTTEQGSRHYKNTDFYNFYSKNNDCVNIIERGNDAPRGGQTGNYLVLEFTEAFYDKYQFWFDAQKQEAERQSKFQEDKNKSFEILKEYAKDNFEEVKSLLNNTAQLQEKLNLPVLLHPRQVKKVLYHDLINS